MTNLDTDNTMNAPFFKHSTFLVYERFKQIFLILTFK